MTGGKNRRRKKDSRIKNVTSTRSVAGSSLKTRFTPLSETEVKQIHRSALDLLETLGMSGATQRVLNTVLDKGCFVNGQGRLCFPASLVEDTLALAAREFVIHGRSPEHDFEARNDRINFCTGGAAVTMLDHKTRRYRPSLLADLYDLARVVDTLPNLQWFTRPVVATDIEDPFELDANTVYACAAGTRKHIGTSFVNGRNLCFLHPMFDQLAGGQRNFRKRPFCTAHATTVVSPMSFAADSLDVVCEAIVIGMPIHSQTGPQAGATAPCALAGTLVQCCAEALASLCVINLLKPGHPVIMGNWAFVSDLRTGAFSGGGGEQALLGAAVGQMAAFYGVPGGTGAGMSDSKLPDNQAGYEKALTMMMASMSGGGFVFESAGMLASLLGCSLEAMVIDDDMLTSLRRVGRGIEVNDETLSVDVIKQAVSGAGHFLGSAQTLEMMESEFVYPEMADRQSAEEWQEKGATQLWDNAATRVAEIMASHRPHYIDAETDFDLRSQFRIHLEMVAGRSCHSIEIK